MYPKFRTVFQLDGSIAKFGIMNKHSKRKFTPEFKFKVALEALQEKQTLAEIAGKYELHASQISDWKQQVLMAVVCLSLVNQKKYLRQRLTTLINSMNKLVVYKWRMLF